MTKNPYTPHQAKHLLSLITPTPIYNKPHAPITQE